MNHIDYYRILNVSKSATLEQIKIAYRQLAKIYHPDLCTTDKKTAEATFKNLSVAYQVLSNADSKTEYDKSIGNFGPSRFSSSSSSSAWNGSRNNIRSPASGTSWQVTRDQYDVHMWNAYHYGDEDSPDKTQGPTTTHRSGWVDPKNKHQSYYRKKNARDWAERSSGVKWSADTAYSTQSKSTSEEGASTRQSRTSSNTRGDPKRTYEKATAATYSKVEQQRQSATENLQKSRAERVQRASDGANEDASSCTVS